MKRIRSSGSNALNLIVLNLLMLVCMAPQDALAQEWSILMSNPNYFHDREEHFSDLSFDIGETKVINSADTDSFNSLLIPTFEGIPRLGQLNKYWADNPQKRMEIADTRQERQAVTEELSHNLGCYLSLLCLQLTSDEFTSENLMVYNSEGYGFTNQYYTYTGNTGQPMQYMIVPRFHVEGMAAGMLSKEKYKEYYCPSGEQCSEGYRQRQGRIWAGPQANEFKKRAAYKEFVDNEVPKLLDWSSGLSRDVALVGTVVLPTYDFQKQGYELNILPIKSSGSQHRQDLHFWPRDPESMGFELNTGFIKNVLLSIPPDKAEAITNRLKTEFGQRNNLMLFTVMIGEIYSLGRAPRGGTHTAFGGNVGYLYDYKDTHIRFYLDPELKELVYETKL